jgi:hypothetical protein
MLKFNKKNRKKKMEGRKVERRKKGREEGKGGLIRMQTISI